MKIAVGVPHLGPLQGYFVDSLLSMTMPAGWNLIRMQDKPVDTARNLIVKTFMESTEFTHLFFMDSDMRFHPHTVARLAALDLPIVSGLYLARTDTPLPHIYDYSHISPEGWAMYNSRCADYGEWLKANPEQAQRPNAWCFDPDPTAVLTCDAVGFGCVLIKREVFESISYPWFEADPETGGAEDFDFCEKARAAGYEIHADMTVQCDHESRLSFIGREEFHACWSIGTEDEIDFAQPVRVEIAPSGQRRIRPNREHAVKVG